MSSPQTSSDAPVLPAAMRLGAAHLVVRDLDRSTAFYREALGFHVLDRDTRTASVGPEGEPLLVLHEDAAARAAGRHAGLYHVALNFGSREELARAAVRLAVTQTSIQGASDHGTHEAIYLPDADGNGLELAADRPRERWRDLSEFLEGGPRPLDTHALLSLVEHEPPAAHAAAGMRVGHLHLHVGDLDEAVAFYTGVVGLEPQAMLGGVAAFLSAGGYHHHLGLNTWRGVGVPAQPEGVVGLHHWTIVLPGEGDVAAVRARVQAAGHATEERPAGFATRDPAGMALEVLAG